MSCVSQFNIFDCDMEANPRFLAHTLSFLASQPRTALVQTPQQFWNIEPNADVFNHTNAFFFQGTQPGLDIWGGTVCCGTNMAIRASALQEVVAAQMVVVAALRSQSFPLCGWCRLCKRL